MTHPAHAELWLWDEGNESELDRHHITATEVEQVFAEGPRWVRNRRHRPGDWKMVGVTSGGRLLTVAVHYDDDRHALRTITGWDATAGERTRYGQ